MGRKITIDGKNIQSRSNKKKTAILKPPRAKPIAPYKVTTTIYGEYRYHRRGSYRNAKGELKCYLRCSKSETSLCCPGRGELNSKGEFKITMDHVQACKEPFLRPISAAREELFTQIKQKPCNPMEVYTSVARKHPVGTQFTPYPSIKTSLLNWRNESLPPLPTHVSEIAEAVNSEIWSRELSYEISIADVDTQIVEKATHELRAWPIDLERSHLKKGVLETYTESHVVLGNPEYASKFECAEMGFIDCTFDSVPNIEGAYQIFTLKIEYHIEVLPVAWALMSRKTQDAYLAVLRVIIEKLLPNFKPIAIMTDFEDPLQNAIRRAFPTADVEGCFFHHCHALLKNRQRFSVITRVTKHAPTMLAEAYSIERDLMNLALLPSDFIEEGFNYLCERLRKNLDLLEIMGLHFDYYQNQWIERVGPGRYSVFRESRRTNNTLERYHRALKALTATRPEIAKFLCSILHLKAKQCEKLYYDFNLLHAHLDAIKNIQESEHAKILVIDHGLKPHRNKDSKSTRREIALNEAWDQLGDLSACTRCQRKNRIAAFLKAVSPHTSLAAERTFVEDPAEVNDVDDTLFHFDDVPEQRAGVSEQTESESKSIERVIDVITGVSEVYESEADNAGVDDLENDTCYMYVIENFEGSTKKLQDQASEDKAVTPMKDTNDFEGKTENNQHRTDKVDDEIEYSLAEDRNGTQVVPGEAVRHQKSDAPSANKGKQKKSSLREYFRDFQPDEISVKEVAKKLTPIATVTSGQLGILWPVDFAAGTAPRAFNTTVPDNSLVSPASNRPTLLTRMKTKYVRRAYTPIPIAPKPEPSSTL